MKKCKGGPGLHQLCSLIIEAWEYQMTSKHFTSVITFNSYNHPIRRFLILLKLKLREGKKLAQTHTADKRV